MTFVQSSKNLLKLTLTKLKRVEEANVNHMLLFFFIPSQSTDFLSEENTEKSTGLLTFTCHFIVKLTMFR